MTVADPISWVLGQIPFTVAASLKFDNDIAHDFSGIAEAMLSHTITKELS